MAKPLNKARCLSLQPEFSRLDRSRSPFLIGLTLLILLFMGASIFYINTHVEVVEIGYDINQALLQKQRLIEENKHLALQIARLKSPLRIEEEAKTQFELLKPAPEQIIYLSSLENSSLFQKLTQEPVETKDPVKTPKEVTHSKVAKNKIPPAKKPVSSTNREKIKTLAKQESPAPIKNSSSVRHKGENVLIAKIVRETTPPKESGVSIKKETRKNRESVPAVLIDPMP